MATLQLPNSVYSVEDAKTLLVEVKSYAKWYSHSTIKQKVGVRHQAVPPEVSEAAATVINSWAAESPLSVESLDSLIATLETLINDSPTMTITLPGVPDGSLKQLLATWARTNISPSVLVSFRFDATILGGMIIRYGSRMYDWSFRRYILAERQNFPRILRHVR